MSWKLAKFNFQFFRHFRTDPIEISLLVPEIQVVEGLQKQQEIKKPSALFGYILESVIESSNSFCLNTSHRGKLENGE